MGERHFRPAERAYCWYCDCPHDLGAGIPCPPMSWSGHAWFQCPRREENEKKYGRPVLVNADGTPYDVRAGAARDKEKRARLREANLALSARSDGGALVKVVGDRIVKIPVTDKLGPVTDKAVAVTDKLGSVTDNPVAVTDKPPVTDNVTDKVCEGCGKPFGSKRSDARYCSGVCRQRARRK